MFLNGKFFQIDIGYQNIDMYQYEKKKRNINMTIIK